jgi:hypothetical protein
MPELFANRMNEKLDSITFDLLIPNVDALLEVVAGKYRSRSAKQRMQKRKLARRQAACVIVRCRFARRWLELDHTITNTGEDVPSAFRRRIARIRANSSRMSNGLIR